MTRPRILIACEFSGAVRDAFIGQGVDAWSCDLLPSDAGAPHIQADVTMVFDWGWDAMIAFPPCTDLSVSGARWWAEKGDARRDAAVGFVRALWGAPIPRVAIENPIGRLSTLWRKPDQVVQPWMYGHGETKATCLWLRGLPPLMVGVVDTGRHPRVHLEAPGPDRWKRRSETYAGIAEAMAAQWAPLLAEAAA
jgi:hypothetical protein